MSVYARVWFAASALVLLIALLASSVWIAAVAWLILWLAAVAQDRHARRA